MWWWVSFQSFCLSKGFKFECSHTNDVTNFSSPLLSSQHLDGLNPKFSKQFCLGVFPLLGEGQTPGSQAHLTAQNVHLYKHPCQPSFYVIKFLHVRNPYLRVSEYIGPRPLPAYLLWRTQWVKTVYHGYGLPCQCILGLASHNNQVEI